MTIMARGRMISKAISLDEKINSLSDDTARLLFTWIIPHLDCEGRLHGDAQTVKSIIFPRRNISTARIDKYLNEFEKKGLIFRFTVNGNTYLLLPQFEKHQLGLQKDREAQSQIPPPPPELIQSKSRPCHSEIKVETKVKIKTKDKESTKLTFGEFNNVILTTEEHAKLVTKFGDEKVAALIANLSIGIKSKGYKYKDHYATILNWERRDSENHPAAKVGKVLPDTKTLKEAWK